MGVSFQNASSLMAVQCGHLVTPRSQKGNGLSPEGTGVGAVFLLSCSHLGNQNSVCLSLIRTPPCEVLKGMSRNRALLALLSGDQENPPPQKPLTLKVPPPPASGRGSSDLAQAQLS